ncbi:MAG TPA: flavin reductase family protein [Spirochaetota bacterium]|nr:flavin reductase family protein [Spirochaetota bacterium]
MDKTKSDILWKNFNIIMEKLPSPGVLLVCGNKNEKENIITIGWLTFGYLWNEPSVTILVRPSRFSYNLLKNNNHFTINVLSNEYFDKLSFCGSHSGAYCDKFEETKLTKVNSQLIPVSSIKESQIILECKTVFSNEILPENLNDLYLAKYYSSEDYHTMFTANIVNLIKNN